MAQEWGWFITGAFLATGLMCFVAAICIYRFASRAVKIGGFIHRGHFYAVERETELEGEAAYFQDALHGHPQAWRGAGGRV